METARPTRWQSMRDVEVGAFMPGDTMSNATCRDMALDAAHSGFWQHRHTDHGDHAIILICYVIYHRYIEIDNP